jgi:hypothetical protein
MQTKLIFRLLICLVLAGLMGTNLSGGEPTNDKEQAKAKDTKGYSADADKARKAKMSRDELAWEKILEENLGDFYLPAYKKEKDVGKETAWDYVKDVPGLPRILLIGDSISRAYTLTVRKELKGFANVHRAPANCGPTKTALKKLDVWLGDGEWNLILFNFGIHDRSTKNNIYAENLERIIARLEKTGAKLLWANSTPLSEGTMGFKRGMMDPKNKAADAVMNKHGIPIIDLYTPALGLINDMQQNKDGCHFTEKGNEALGTVVAAALRGELTKRNKETGSSKEEEK